MKYIVAIDVDSEGKALAFIANWKGDPGRTCVEESAKRYPSVSSATFGLAHARKYRDLPKAEIREVTK